MNEEKDWEEIWNKQISPLTEMLFEKMENEKSLRTMGLVYDSNNQQRCGVCGNVNGIEKERYGEFAEEQHETCHSCGYHKEYLYGHTTITIENMGWYYSYTEKMEDDSFKEREKETRIVSGILGKVFKGVALSEEEKSYVSLLQKRSEKLLAHI
ncbi:hypothetical protein JMA_40680 (plasmid) [Jeotgalibacillus malaysiensis]|uniref:Uncharacterized protein n=1 Tax=Jeotgalibacillus malaysiensis TaxID=1508404 RepID=A0A0B5ATG8_9BACL|nr:hypothetical protein [Jeotgalibacillus malaysiensis]AJD93386.1 hypothetical protein JMA_40680 [Jeotgalibacillus malaysiensis]